MFCLNRNDLYLLDNLSPKEEAIVTALLRTYGGLFTDFVYIDESLIAHQLIPAQNRYMSFSRTSQHAISSNSCQGARLLISHTQETE